MLPLSKEETQKNQEVSLRNSQHHPTPCWADALVCISPELSQTCHKDIKTTRQLSPMLTEFGYFRPGGKGGSPAKEGGGPEEGGWSQDLDTVVAPRPWVKNGSFRPN